MKEVGKTYYLEQAELAEAYAHSRPAPDLEGFFAALRDAENFRRIAGSMSDEATTQG
jgi:hypothetical protein